MRSLETWVLEYLMNSLWQVPLIFGAAQLMVKLARRGGFSIAAEHRIWVGVLLLEGVLPGCFVRLGAWWRWLQVWSSGSMSGSVHVTQGAGTAAGGGMIRLPEWMLAAGALVYGGSVLCFAGRLAWGLWRTDALRRLAVPFILTGERGRIWENCVLGLGLRRVALAVSRNVVGPVTVGAWCGTMLVPPDFLPHLTDADLEAVFAHELTHIRRRDFFKNAGYSVLTLPVAYHPALWLTRSRVAVSREMVCDATAAEWLAGKERYARSLLRLAALVVHGRPARMSHAIGICDANSFEGEL